VGTWEMGGRELGNRLVVSLVPLVGALLVVGVMGLMVVCLMVAVLLVSEVDGVCVCCCCSEWRGKLGSLVRLWSSCRVGQLGLIWCCLQGLVLSMWCCCCEMLSCCRCRSDCGGRSGRVWCILIRTLGCS
jgi:hypothetical protein